MLHQRASLLCRYHYDPLDQLIAHAPANLTERQRFYCKTRLATEIQGAMRQSIFQQDEVLLAQKRRDGDVTETALLATDQQRSVLHLLRDNQQRQTMTYSPYGHRPAASGLLSLLGFNGEQPDPVTGCYLLGNGYRAFNPVLMRFNSPDSWSPFWKGGLNPYAYCRGDSINQSDSNGRWPSALKSNVITPERVMKSGETRTRTITTKTEDLFRTTRSNGDWSETITLYKNDTKVEGKSVFSDSGLTSVHPHNGPSKTYINNATLSDLSYSKIPGNELRAAYKTFDLPAPHYRLNDINLFNAQEQNYHRIKNTTINPTQTATDIDQIHSYAYLQTRAKALRGNVNGVNPDFIQQS